MYRISILVVNAMVRISNIIGVFEGKKLQYKISFNKNLLQMRPIRFDLIIYLTALPSNTTFQYIIIRKSDLLEGSHFKCI